MKSTRYSIHSMPYYTGLHCLLRVFTASTVGGLAVFFAPLLLVIAFVPAFVTSSSLNVHLCPNTASGSVWPLAYLSSTIAQIKSLGETSQCS